MPQRNYTNNKQPTTVLRKSPRFIRTNQTEPTTVPRRSPRFLEPNQTEPEDPSTVTPDPIRYRVTSLDLPCLISTEKATLVKSHKENKESNTGSRRYKRSSVGVDRFTCLRRSRRFSEKHNVDRSIEKIGLDKRKQDGSAVKSGDELGNDSGKQFVGSIEKRLTRSAIRGNEDGNALKIGNAECNRCVESASNEFSDAEGSSADEKSKLSGNLCNLHIGQSKKRMARSAYGKETKVVDNLTKKINCKFEKEMKRSSDADLVVMEGGGERKESDIDNGRKQVGIKRKRNQIGENVNVQGWTKDQELALQRAYFAAKPTPHFWKKVARLVPGKSAQDCFDEINSKHLTPLQSQPRSRMKETNSSSLSLSASKLLETSVSKIKKPSRSKQKNLQAQRTVRKLLQKQCQFNQDDEADLFSVLEPTTNPSIEVFQQGVVLCTPERRDQEKLGYLKRCQTRSSSAQMKHLSRFSGCSSGATVFSPPILKQVKNKALHDKYIDHLHCREAKRKAASKRAAKCQGEENGMESSNVQKMGAIKAAKNALVFHAIDAINQFQHLQANAMNNFPDSDDDGIDSDEDESEVRPS